MEDSGHRKCRRKGLEWSKPAPPSRPSLKEGPRQALPSSILPASRIFQNHTHLSTPGQIIDVLRAASSAVTLTTDYVTFVAGSVPLASPFAEKNVLRGLRINQGDEEDKDHRD